MESVVQLQSRPFEPKDGQKYKVIHITDVLGHTTEHPTTESIGRKVAKAFRNGEPGRVYVSTSGDRGNDFAEFLKRLHQDPSFIEYVRKEEEGGYKVLLHIPRTGIPFGFGKDTKQFLGSKRGKRILRNLAKKQVN